jgi:hypothetical protein
MVSDDNINYVANTLQLFYLDISSTPLQRKAWYEVPGFFIYASYESQFSYGAVMYTKIIKLV